MENIDAIKLLQEKAKVINRLPKKSDFTQSEVCLIKAKLGPWNRALEEAGLKDVSVHFLEKQKREKQKRQLKKQNKD